MKIARLRHRIEIQTYTETQDDTISTIKTWNTIMTVWAEIQSVSGYVTYLTQQIDEKVTHKFIIRYQPYITSENWILMDSRRFRIRSVTNYLEKNRFLELACEEVFLAQEYFQAGVNKVAEPLEQNLPNE